MLKIKKSFIFALCLLPIAVIAGIFVGFYQLGIYSEEIIAEVVAELGNTDILIVVAAIQTVGYALFCGFCGYILADKLGLWKPIIFEKKSVIVTLVISAVGGIVFSLDHWIFGSMIDGIQSSNAASLNVTGVMTSVLYGGIIEEVMLRLFFMSLIAFALWKLFFKRCGRENIPTIVFVTANIVAAILFAAGHLPATTSIFGTLTPLILFRCFLLNGGFGLVFGWLYRKYGIIYAMLGTYVIPYYQQIDLVYFHLIDKRNISINSSVLYIGEFSLCQKIMHGSVEKNDICCT